MAEPNLANDAWEALLTAHAAVMKQLAAEDTWTDVSMREYDVLYTLSKDTEPLRLSDALLICVLFPVKTTPGCKLKMPVGSRPSKGRLAICSVPKACPRVASVVLTRGASPVTSTVTVPPVTCIATFTWPGHDTGV